MSAEVVSLHGKQPAPGEPLPDLIEVLEGLLSDARNGTLQAFSYATVRRRGTGEMNISTGSGWVRGPFTTHALCAATMHLHACFAARLLED